MNNGEEFTVEDAKEFDRAPFTGQPLLLGLTVMSPGSH